MGKYDSSIYRVRPLMKIVENDHCAFLKFISLVSIPSLDPPNTYAYDGEHCVEKLLKPSKRHLSALIAYMASKNHSAPTKNEKRNALFFPNPKNPNQRAEACLEALAALEEDYRTLSPNSRQWYLFEGFTHPDIFIEGDDYIIICEGKWTESNITTTTTHLSSDGEFRNQMIRHIQGALNLGSKKVYAFYIVDEDCGYESQLTKESLATQLEMETIKIPSSEKAAILNAFYGYTTWQKIKNAISCVDFKEKEEIFS